MRLGFRVGGSGVDVNYPIRAVAAATVGGLLGLSGFLGGLYDFGRWGVLAVVVAAFGIAAVMSSASLPRGWSALAPAALALLACIDFLSARWAEDEQQALLAGHRAALYAVALALLVMLFRERRAPTALLAGYVAGVLVTAVIDLHAMLDAGGQSLFFRGRLDSPLGYVNGQAGMFALACWPLVAAAERAERRVVAGAAAGLASLLLSLVVLTQSRGALAALIISAAVVVGVLPGRWRRVLLLGVLAAGAAVTWGRLSAVSESFAFSTGRVDPDASSRAAIGAIAVATAVAITWCLTRMLVAWFRAPERLRGMGAHPALVWTAGLIIVVAGAVAAGPSLAQTINDRADSFKALKPATANSRLTSAGGNRYDYWRVALRQFERWPVGGSGAGNYDRTYFVDRRTEEDIRQPHSIEFQALAETGVVGFLALMTVLGTAGVAAVMRARRAGQAGTALGLTTACVGILATWAVHTSVDWMYLLPGVTGPALAALAFLTGRWDRQSRRPTPRLVRPVIFAALILIIGSLGIQLAADRDRKAAADALPARPEKAIDEARSALKLVSNAPDAYYALAAAEARLNRYGAARATLLEASRNKPHDFVPYALLGDLASRRRDFATARADYERAVELNPRSTALRKALRSARKGSGAARGP